MPAIGLFCLGTPSAGQIYILQDTKSGLGFPLALITCHFFERQGERGTILLHFVLRP